jgi:hypothetical protein
VRISRRRRACGVEVAEGFAGEGVAGLRVDTYLRSRRI